MLVAVLAAALVSSSCAWSSSADTDADTAVATGMGEEVTSADGLVAGFVEGDSLDGAKNLLPVVYDTEGEVVFSDDDPYDAAHPIGLIWHPSLAGDGEDLWILSDHEGAARIARTDGVWVKVWADGEVPDEVRDRIKKS